MLSTVLTFQHSRFNALAEAWLALGARTFSVWENEHLLMQWPDNILPDDQQLSAPIKVDGKTLGELKMTGFSNPSSLDRLQAEADLIAQLVSLEEELDTITAELVDAQDQLLALYKLTESTRNRLDINQVLTLLTREAAYLVKAKGVFILLWSAGKPLRFKQYPAKFLEGDYLPEFFELIHTIRDELLLSGDHFSDISYLDIENIFLKPIPIRENLVAIIGFLFPQPSASLSPYLKLARAIAEHTGAQLENVTLHQELIKQAKVKTELELAAQIQLRLLPQYIPQISDLDIATGSIPALQVGGDFYDFLPANNDLFKFVVGDVSGKGMSAAMLMAMCRTVFRSKSQALNNPTPEQILAAANEVMYDDFTEVGMFATIFVGAYDIKQQTLFYANAGHSPVIYCPVDGPPQLMEADGPAMGVLPMNLSENCSLSMEPGDVVIVGTDGFNEARNPNHEMFGYERLMHLIKSVAHKSAQEIADALYQTVQEFSADQPQDDDETLIIIKRV